jgi:opacity protein-like surface antigen
MLARTTLFLLATASLGAADFTGGIQLGPAFPLGDMKTLTDSSVGGQLNLFGLWTIDGGHMIRARLDGTAASGKPKSIPSPAGPQTLNGQVKIDASIGSLGADYLYYLNGSRDAGPYFGAGLAAGTAKLSLALAGNSNTTDFNSSTAVLGLYGGYQFNSHWSAELTFRSARFKKTIGTTAGNLDFSYSMPALALVAGYTF